MSDSLKAAILKLCGLRTSFFILLKLTEDPEEFVHVVCGLYLSVFTIFEIETDLEGAWVVQLVESNS